MKKLLRTALAAATMFLGATLTAGTQEDLQKMIRDGFTIGSEMSMDKLVAMYAEDAEIVKPEGTRTAKEVFTPSIELLNALKKGDLLTAGKCISKLEGKELSAEDEAKVKALSAEDQKKYCAMLTNLMYNKAKQASELRLKTLKFEAFKEEGNNAVLIALSVSGKQWERSTFYFEKQDGKWKVIGQESVYLPLEQKKAEAK